MGTFQQWQYGQELCNLSPKWSSPGSDNNNLIVVADIIRLAIIWILCVEDLSMLDSHVGAPMLSAIGLLLQSQLIVPSNK
jgi:hypothetical protein